MFDPNRTIRLITGALFDAEPTWRSYLPEAENWQKTAILLTGPLIIVSAVLSYLIGFVGSGVSILGLRPTLLSTILGVVSGAIAIGVIAFALSALSGMFGGKTGFGRGLAAASLAFVPGYAGQALSTLPWIGWLLGFGLFIFALVLLWRIIPVYLEVPDSKRTGHYVLSLVGTIVVMIVISALLRPIIGPDMSRYDSFSDRRSTDRGLTGVGGIAGEAMRHAELMAAAEEDRYDPPSDGKLDEDQVEAFIRVVSRAQEIMQEKTERMQELAERADRDQKLSIREMSEIMRGSTTMMGMNTIELEVVKSADGNWAEHQWVKEALRQAYIQKDISAAVKHNYELYKQYEDELRPFVTR